MSDPLFERPLDDMLPAARPLPAAARAATGQAVVVRDRSAADLLTIGRSQRWLVLVILLRLLVEVGVVGMNLLMFRPDGDPNWVPFAIVLTVVGWLGEVALVVVALTLVVLIASKLHGTTATVVLAVCLFLPCVGLILLLVVNAQATAELRRNGVRVGLFGARRADLRALAAPAWR